MKFIHIADVHLGVTPDEKREWGEARRQSIWDSFARVVSLAREEGVDFLFIAGDLFHRQPLKRELKAVNDLFKTIPQVKILLMAGNHDFLQPKSYYRGYPWEKNVFFFEKEEITSFDFPEERVTVHGLSYWHRELPGRLYEGIPLADTDRIHILLAHGGTKNQLPFVPERLIEDGFSYVAAGHIHKGGSLYSNQVIMAGALEPVDCNDLGPHGYWMGTITKEQGQTEVHVAFHAMHTFEYCQEYLFVTPQMTQDNIEELVQKRIRAGEENRLYHIILEGTVDADMDYDWKKIASLPRVVDVTERLRPNYDYEKMLEEQADSLLGRYILSMNKLPQDEVTKKALEYGVSALLGNRICK